MPRRVAHAAGAAAGAGAQCESRCGDQVLSRAEPCGCGVQNSREHAGCGGQLSAGGPRAGAHRVMVGGAARRLRGRRGGIGRRGGVWRAGQLDLERCRAVRIAARCVLLPAGRPTVVGTTEAVGARDAGAGVCCAAPGGTSPRSRLRMVCVNRALFGVSIVCVCACVLAGDELQPVSLFWFEL